MKKLFAIILIFAVFLGFSTLCVDAEQKKKKVKRTVTKVEIETKDGFLLVGDLYFAPQKKPPRPLVILLHSFGSRASDWGTLPQTLRLENYNVLALDLRGHGRSVYNSKLKYKSRMAFKKEDWSKYPLDVVSAVNFIAKNYPRIDTNQLYIVGADIGANASVLSASIMKVKPKKMVLISPFVSFKGLDIAFVVPKLDTVPMMVMASKSDKYSYSQADIVSRLIHSKKRVRYYETGGSGVLLLKRNPLSYAEIVNFIISDK